MTGPPAPGGSRARYAPDFLLELFTNPLDPGYADAAEARRRHGPRPPGRRAGAYALKLVTLLAVGFLLAVAYREAVEAEPERSQAHAGLVQEVKAGQERTDALQAESDKLRREVSAARQAALGGNAAELTRIREQEAVTGLSPVTGPGAVVRLADAPAPIDPATGRPTNAEVSRVLDVDLQVVANALWAAGAEAVAINGQRLTATSTIRTAGNAILVDFRPVTSPYEVAAIGPTDLEQLFGHTATAAALADLARQYGLGYATRTERSLALPAAPGSSLRYAHPSPPPSPSVSPSGGN